MKVIVVGAGIVGASTAYHLSRQGAEVTLVDRADDGQATAAGAGIVCPWLSRVDDPDWYRLAAASARYYPELMAWLAEDGFTDTGYKTVGALALAESPAALEGIAARARKRAVNAPEIGTISTLAAGEPATLFPPLRPDWSALHVTGAARVDGRLVRDALLAAAGRRGVRRERGEATVTVADDGSWQVRLDRTNVAADAVVVAAGAWSDAALRVPGAGVPIEPQRGQIMHLRLPGVQTGQWPVVLPPSSHYLLAFDDSRVVVGATRETGSGFDYRTTATGLREVLDHAISVAPGLAEATVVETRIGFRPFSGTPLLGPITPNSPVVVATGLGATGLTMGPYCGAIAAGLALGQVPDIDLAPYAPLRDL